MRVLDLALLGSLLTLAGTGSAAAQDPQIQLGSARAGNDLARSVQQRQAGAARVIAGTRRGMAADGTFSFQSKPHVRATGRIVASSSSSPVVSRLIGDGGPMPVPTYLLRNGVVLQATHGINPGEGVSCIAYCNDVHLAR
jgi:hypothetical protein